MNMQAIAEQTYTFAKLSKKAKQVAIENNYSINVEYDDWWRWTYEDANLIGLQIESFDLNYRQIDSRMEESIYDICKNIMEHHGEQCDTYKLAAEYMPQFIAARLKGWNPAIHEICDFIFDDKPEDERYEYQEEWEAEFKRKLEKRYLKHLENEYEYLTSNKAIAETLKSNAYEFTEEGERI